MGWIIFWGIAMAWLLLGYMAGKANYRYDKTAGESWFLFFAGALGYVLAWLGTPNEMMQLHGIKPRGDKPTRASVFFGEADR